MRVAHPGVDLSRRVDGSYWSSTPDSFFDGFLGGWNRRAAVEADRAQRVPEGWKLVPVEPTAEMLDAGRKACNGNMYPQDMLHGPRAMMADRWYAAINAAPSLLITTPAPAQQERKPMTDEQASAMAAYFNVSADYVHTVYNRVHGIKE